MKRTRTATLIVIAFLGMSADLYAQTAPSDFRDEFLMQLDYSGDRLVSLAEATPDERFTWSPGDGVMSIAQVYMHIARYNYYYPETALGIAAPVGLDLDELESTMDKAQVIEILNRSFDHVRKAVRAMPESTLSEPTTLYGREIQGWGVLLQLLAHMNEHVGQSIAYARMNEITPPWSRGN